MDGDLNIEDEVGARFALTFTRDGGATAEINDSGEWSAIGLDRDQLIKIASHIIYGLSPTGETVDKIIAALAPGQRALGLAETLPSDALGCIADLGLPPAKERVVAARIRYLIAAQKVALMDEVKTLVHTTLNAPFRPDEAA